MDKVSGEGYLEQKSGTSNSVFFGNGRLPAHIKEQYSKLDRAESGWVSEAKLLIL